MDGAEVAFVDKINLCDGRITRVSPLIQPRYMASVVEGAKCIRVFGGLCNDEFLASCEEYNTETDEFVVATVN